MFKILCVLVTLAILFISSFSSAQQSCQDIFSQASNVSRYIAENRLRMAPGSSSTLNLRLLRHAEEIPESVLERFSQEMRVTGAINWRVSQVTALELIANPTPENQQILFRQLRRLVPIAVRPLLHLLNDDLHLEEYLQSGYLKLWEQIVRIQARGPLQNKNYQKKLYWSGTLNNIRASIFAVMRVQYRTQYSLTPVDFARGANVTFQEAVLLFGETEADLLRIADSYGIPYKTVLKEKELQEVSRGENSAPSEYAISTEPPVEESIQSQHLVRLVEDLLQKLSKRHPREAYVLRLSYIEGMSFDRVAEELSVSRERVRQLLASGLKFLKTNRLRVTLEDIDFINPHGSRGDRFFVFGSGSSVRDEPAGSGSGRQQPSAISSFYNSGLDVF